MSANEHNSKWTLRSAGACLLEGIEQSVQVTDGDLRIFIFGHACGRDAQSPNACVVLRNRLLERRRVSQEVLVLNRGKLRVRGRGIVRRGTTREDNPGRERTTPEVGDVADVAVSEKNAQDPQARCAIGGVRFTSRDKYVSIWD